MAAVGSVWASGVWSDVPWAALTWADASAVAPSVAASYGDVSTPRAKRKYRLIEPDGRVRVFRTRAEMERRIAELLEDEAPEAVEQLEQPVKSSPKKRKARSVGTELQTETVSVLTADAQMALAALMQATAALSLSMILEALRNDEEAALMAILAVAA